MRKYYGFKTFKVTDHLSVHCKAQRTSYDFRHLAVVYRDYIEVGRSKECYYNRTWEAWEYQTVVRGALNTLDLEGEEKKQADAFLAENQDAGAFRSIAVVASLGNVLCQSQEDKNAWKLRMLKAGLENQGLSFPENWDQLSEDEKQRRLDGAINTIK